MHHESTEELPFRVEFKIHWSTQIMTDLVIIRQEVTFTDMDLRLMSVYLWFWA